MIRCEIKERIEKDYYLFKSKNEEFSMVIELIGVFPPVKGDILFIPNELVDKTSYLYTQPYFFQLVKGVKRQTVVQNETEYVIFRSGKKDYFLKRIYG